MTPTPRGAAAPPTLEALEEQLRTMQHRLGEFLFAEGGDERLDHPLLRSDVQALADAERALASLAAERAALVEALRGVGYFDPEAEGELCWCGGDEAELDEHDAACLAARAAYTGKAVGDG